MAQYDPAIADLGKAIEFAPDHAQYYKTRADIYRDKGEPDRAIADYDQAIKLDPKFANAYRSRANAYDAMGDLEKALADRTRLIELDPKSSIAYRMRGNTYFNKADFANASADFLHAAELKDDAYAIIFRFLARTRAGENAASELEANAGRLKTKEWPYAVIELYLGKRQPGDTLAAAIKPDDQCEANFYIGEWHILQNKGADAGPSLRKAAETCPKGFFEYTAAQAELKRLNP